MIGSSSRHGAKVRLLVVHTTEGIRTCPDLRAFFEREYQDNPDTAGSSHAAACDSCQSEFLPYGVAAWTVRSGNAVSDNIELCGMAGWDRVEWLRHMTMLDLTAQWLAKRAKARGVPLVKLSPADVAAGRSGVIGHVDWTNGMHDGSHWDPGPNFPWDLVMPLAQKYLTGGDTDLTPEQDALLREIHHESTQRLPNRVDGKQSDTVLGFAANADALGFFLRTVDVPALHAEIAALSAKVDQVATGGLDLDVLASKVIDQLLAKIKG